MIRPTTFLIVILGMAVSVHAAQKVRVVVKVPGDTPANASIHIAGSVESLKSWDPGGVQLTRQADGTIAGDIDLEAGQVLEFKINRGNWATVEKYADGTERENRSVRVEASTKQIDVTVERWADSDNMLFAAERIPEIVYMMQKSTTLTFDVLKPANANKAAVIWVVSSGFSSSWDDIQPAISKPFTENGFTVFAVIHGPQSSFKMFEMAAQVSIAVRYIRSHADEYGIDPDRIGIAGSGSGAQLALLVAGIGDDGMAGATHPINKASSRVNAAAAIAPPVDYSNWGKAGSVYFDKPVKEVYLPVPGIDQPIVREISPINFVNAKFPPTLLIHGSADQVVPLQQAQLMDDALGKAGVKRSLVVIPEAGHDDKTITAGFPKIIDWFKAELLK